MRKRFIEAALKLFAVREFATKTRRAPKLAQKFCLSKFLVCKSVALMASALAVVVVCSEPALCTIDTPVISPGTGTYSTNQTSVTMTQAQGYQIDYTCYPGAGGSGGVYTAPVSNCNNPAYFGAQACSGGCKSSTTSSYIQTDLNTANVTRTGLILWLKSDWAALSSCNCRAGFPGAGENINQWLDVSASGSYNNANQTTTAAEPTFYSFDGPASSPSLGFNGSSQYLSLTSGFGNLTSGFSIFAVIEPQSTGTSTVLVSGNTGPTDMVSLQTSGSQVIFTAYNGTTASTVTSSSGAIVPNEYQIVEVVDTGTSATIYVNGVSVGSGTVQALKNVARSANYVATNLTKSTYWPGQISELLAYSAGLSTANRQNIESYLEQRYLLSAPAAPLAPIISVGTSTLTAPQQVAITANPYAIIRFTQDGSTPGSTSPLYTSPVTIAYSQTLNAIAIQNGLNSSVASAVYTLNSTQWPAPSTTDTTTLRINLQQPAGAIPP